MSKAAKREAGPHDTGKHERPTKPAGPHRTGRDTSPTATRRDDHPGKKAGKAEHEQLIADQRKTANTLGESYGGSEKSVDAQIKSNRPGIAPKS